MHFKRGSKCKLAQTAKLVLLVAVKGRRRPTIPSIYAQRHFMNHKYNAAIGIETLKRNKTLKHTGGPSHSDLAA